MFEALDTAGQWYLDRPQGRLYYLPRPGEDMTAAEIMAPRLTQVLRVVGRPGALAHDLRFEGLTFSHTEWQPPADYASSLQAGIEVPGALFFDYAERCTVSGGGIEHIGNFGVEVGVGCAEIENSHNEIVHNHIYDLYQSAIAVGSVQDFGPSQARGNIIEYNHVHDIGQGMLSDVAGIYTCSTPDSRIRYNRVHDVSRRDYGGWGIYPDQGSHELLIENNLVYRCQDGALFAHHNQNITAENNIFAFSRTAQIERYGMGGFELTCRRNLIYYEEGLAIGSAGIENSGTNVCAFDRNLYWNASGQPVLFGGKTFAQWQATGQEKGGLVADPLFADPPHGDFTLRPGSPAAQLGFEPWDMSRVGPRPASAKSK